MRKSLIASALLLGLTCHLVSAQSYPTTRDDNLTIVETAIAAGSFKTLVTAVKAAGLVEALSGEGPFTVFAPTDDAFGKLPKGTIPSLLKPEAKGTLTSILTYHVVPGRFEAKQVLGAKALTTLNGQRLAIAMTPEGPTVGGVRIVSTDIRCKNGVIHVLDAVAMPATKNLVQVASAAGSFKTLLAAATAAGLAPTLSEGGPFTVFAPTDAAFAKLPAGTVENLLKPENKAKLVAILKYHVVSGRVYSPQAVKLGKATTLQGGAIRISTDSKGAMVNEARILSTDIEASNGVVHVIDSVILPK